MAATGIPMMDGGGGFGGMPPGLAQAIQSAVSNAIHSTENLSSGPTHGSETTRTENGTTTRTVAMSFQVVDGQLVPTSNNQGTPTTQAPSGVSASDINASANSRNNNNAGQAQDARNNPAPLAVDHPPPRMMAEVMAEYRRTQQRLEPHWDRLDTMLRDDPSFENEEETNRHQDLFRNVTEVMHFLSHAQHAISDAMLNLSTTPPRQLRARPFMIAPIIQSAVVQNVPIAVQVPAGVARSRNGRSATTSSSSSTATPTASGTAAAVEPMETSESSSSDGENVSSLQGSVEQGVMQQLNAELASAARVLGQTSNNDATSRSPSAPASGSERNGSEATADIEVSMEPIVFGIEMGPEITIGSQGVETNSNRASPGRSPSNANLQTDGIQGVGAPSAGMIQNMIQAAFSNMGTVANVSVQEVSQPTTVGSSSSSSSSTSTNSSPNQPGQNSSARGNTQTQPTTSTRTRSSTQVINMPAGPMRPPVGFMGPNGFQGPMGPLPNHNFDMLLPCNSHHIPQHAIRRGGIGRENRNRRAFQQQQRPRSSSVPPRGALRGNLRSQPGTPTSNERGAHGSLTSNQAGIRSQTRSSATSARGTPHQSPSPHRMQQTATLPGGGSVTIDIDTNFDFGSFFGRTPPPPIQRAHAARNSSSQGHTPNLRDEGLQSTRNQAEESVNPDLEPSLDNLIYGLQQRIGSGGPQPANNGMDPIANVVRQAMSDDGMLNVIQGIVGQVFGAMQAPQSSGEGRGSDATPTINQFLESMPDYSYTDGEDILTDFLISLARVLTFRDLITIVGAGATGQAGLSNSSQEVIGRLQEPMQNFMRRRMLSNSTEGTTSENVTSPNTAEIEASFLRLLDDSFSPHLESCAELANVREDIDFAETLHNFLTVRLTELAVHCVWNTQLNRSEFGNEFYHKGLKFLSDLTRMCLMSFSDGQLSIERVVQNRMANISEDVGPSVSQWTMSSAIGHLRNYVGGVTENGENDVDMFNQFVIRPEASSSRRLARQQRMEQRQRLGTQSVDSTDTEVASALNRRGIINDQQDEDETFETPRSSPEIMITDNSPPEHNTNGEMEVDEQHARNESKKDNASKCIVQPSLLETPVAPSTELAFPPELLPRSQGIDMVVGREHWHRQVPPEWVPIITRDIQAQQQIPGIAPFSDAYLSTQPAKKRRLAEARKPEGSVEKVISDTLKDAIKVSGVQPKASTPGTSPGNNTAGISAIASDVSKDGGVQAAVKNDARGAIKRRLQQDPDFTPERFPDSKDFVAKK